MIRLFLFLLCFFAQFAYADYPASVVYPYKSVDYSSPEQYFSSWQADQNLCKPNPGYSNTVCAFESKTSRSPTEWDVTYTATVSYVSGAPNTIIHPVIQVLGSYKCPNGGVLTGTQCVKTCPYPEEQLANGQCVKNCTGKAGQPTTNNKYSFSGAVDQWSVSGCKVRCKFRVLAQGGGTGEVCTYTGASADPNQPESEALSNDPPPDKTPPDCLGKGQGYITSSTGKTTCVASGNAPEGQNPTKKESDSVKESGTPGPDGNPNPGAGDYKKEETTTSSSGGKSTTTTKTTENAQDDGNGLKVCPKGYILEGELCTKTSTTTEDTGDFCQKNPTHATCKGDKDTDECIDHPERASCSELRDAPPEDGLGGQTLGVSSISVVGVSGSGGCPSGGSMPKGLGNYDFSPMCDFASAMQPIVLAFAFLSAGLIVIGAFKE